MLWYDCLCWRKVIRQKQIIFFTSYINFYYLCFLISWICEDGIIFMSFFSTDSSFLFPPTLSTYEHKLTSAPNLLSNWHNPTISSLIIIIMLCRQHRYPWPSLATSPYRSSLLVGPQGYIPYPHRAAVCRFELVVLLLLGHIRGSIGVHHLWAHPCFSSNVLHVWFI